MNVNNIKRLFSLGYSCDGTLDETPHRSRIFTIPLIPITIVFIVYIAWICSISFVLRNENPIVR